MIKHLEDFHQHFASHLRIFYTLLAYSWHCLLVGVFCSILQNVEILLAGNRLSSCEMLGENQNLIFSCMKAPSGNLGKSMPFSLKSLKATFECLKLHSLNILSCCCLCKHPVYSGISKQILAKGCNYIIISTGIYVQLTSSGIFAAVVYQVHCFKVLENSLQYSLKQNKYCWIFTS